MRTHTETVYEFSDEDTPLVVAHRDGTVSLSMPDYGREGQGRGFRMQCTTHHIAVVHTLLKALNTEETILAHNPDERDLYVAD